MSPCRPSVREARGSLDEGRNVVRVTGLRDRKTNPPLPYGEEREDERRLRVSDRSFQIAARLIACFRYETFRTPTFRRDFNGFLQRLARRRATTREKRGEANRRALPSLSLASSCECHTCCQRIPRQIDFRPRRVHRVRPPVLSPAPILVHPKMILSFPLLFSPSLFSQPETPTYHRAMLNVRRLLYY